MTDDLLDEALARANRYNHASNCPCDPDRDPYVGCACGETRREDLRRDVRALVERVQRAEAERDSLRFELDGARAVNRKNNEYLIAERDEARGKLDKVRALADEAPDNLLDELRTLLAILDD